MLSKFKERLISVVYTNWGSLVSEVDSEVKNEKKITILSTVLHAPHLRSWRQGHMKVGFRKN